MTFSDNANLSNPRVQLQYMPVLRGVFWVFFLLLL